MERNEVCEILSDNMDNIYGFALSKTGNKADAEDLANDICVQILSSYKNLKEDGAFYGFMWSVARNTYKKFLRKKNHTPSYGSFMDIDYNTPENKCIDNEEIFLLRRELSLLAKKYREVTVAFYIDEKSGTQISKELNIYPETVRKAVKISTELAGTSVPKRLSEKGKTAVMFDAMINTPGIIVDMLLENGTLVLPKHKEGLGIIGVVK